MLIFLESIFIRNEIALIESNQKTTKQEFTTSLKEHTAVGGIHAINVFVDKPFIGKAPDSEKKESEKGNWKSGELFTCYHDWLFHKNEEVIFDCNSGEIPHQHCMDILIAEKIV